MKIIGKVVSIELETTVQGKDKTYPGWELVYREGGNGEVKSITKHANTLKYNKVLKAGLESLSAGDMFTMEQQKNDAGYWEPKEVVKGVAETAQPSTGTPRQQTGNSGGNWPTSEERAQTQTHIIRQNCVTNAVNFVNTTCVKKDQTVANVLKIAKQFENFVHTGDTGTIEDMQSDNLDSGVE